MEIRAITTQAEFLSVREDWEELLARAPAANIFLTFDWLHTWWRHYGGAAQLCILAAYEGRALVGLAPLMIREHQLAGIPVYRHAAFLGTGVSDRLDLLLMAGQEQTILQAMVNHLRSLRWDILDLQEIPEESVTVQLLPGFAEPLRMHVEVAPQSVCPVIKLTTDPGKFLAGLGKKSRYNIGYYARRLARKYEVRVDLVKGGPQLGDSLDAFLQIYRKLLLGRPTSNDLMNEKFAVFRREVAVCLEAWGRVVLALLRVDGHAVAAELSFLYRGTCYNYNLCYDPEWKRENVRQLIQWEVIRHAIMSGCHEYDCLRGEEAYKYRWGAQPRRHVRIRIFRKTPKLRLLQAGVRLARLRRHLAVTD